MNDYGTSIIWILCVSLVCTGKSIWHQLWGYQCVCQPLFWGIAMCRVVSSLTISLIRRWKRTGMDVFCITGILSMLGYTSIVAQVWLGFLRPYLGKSVMVQFKQCMQQMLQISYDWGMTYEQVNLIYFVYPEVVLLVFNAILFVKLNRLAKKNYGTPQYSWFNSSLKTQLKSAKM